MTRPTLIRCLRLAAVCFVALLLSLCDPALGIYLFGSSAFVPLGLMMPVFGSSCQLDCEASGDCNSGTTHSTYQVDIAGVTSKFPVTGCEASVNGSFVVSCKNGPSCLWESGLFSVAGCGTGCAHDFDFNLLTASKDTVSWGCASGGIGNITWNHAHSADCGTYTATSFTLAGNTSSCCQGTGSTCTVTAL